MLDNILLESTFEILLGLSLLIASASSCNSLARIFLPVQNTNINDPDEPRHSGKTELVIKLLAGKLLFVLCLALLWVYRSVLNMSAVVFAYVLSLLIFMLILMWKYRKAGS